MHSRQRNFISGGFNFAPAERGEFGEMKEFRSDWKSQLRDIASG